MVGIGVPVTMQRSSTVSVGLTTLGLIGMTNAGAIPVSYFSVNTKSTNIFLIIIEYTRLQEIANKNDKVVNITISSIIQ